MSLMQPLEEEACHGKAVQEMATRRDESVLMGACYIPKERTAKLEGDDAHFICEEKKTLGLADGVGGWSKHGIDAGVYSRELMLHAEAAVKDEPSDGGVDLHKVLNFAYSNTLAKGSSTACLITIKDRTLHALNVGDSGFRVLRKGVCVYQSPIQQSHFNCPFQLGQASRKDKPSCAQALEIPVEDGDIIVAGTDGLFDNMYDQDIEYVVKEWSRNGIGAVEDLACIIAGQALYLASDKDRFSPYALAAGSTRIGGKMDDITVIVAHIL